MVFKISEKFIQSRKNLVWAMATSSIVFTFVIFSFIARAEIERGGNPSPFWVAGLTGIPLLSLVMLFTWRSIAKRFRSLKLEIGAKSITLHSNDLHTEIEYSSITSLTFHSNPVLIIFIADKNRYSLFGYEKIEEIEKALSKKIDSKLTKKVVRKIDWTRPIPMFFLILIGMVIGVILILFEHGAGFGRLLGPLFLMGMGVFILFFMPVNAIGKQKWAGLFFIVLGLLEIFFRI